MPLSDVEPTREVATSRKARAIYMSVDMEGCATLVHWDEVQPGASAEYERARRIITDEVNAAIQGAYAGGATAAIVNDSHSKMRNLLADRIDARAHVVSGNVKPQFMLEGLSSDCDAAFFIGYHGAIGDACAVMAHTYSPRVIYECRLNGKSVGELTINAALAGQSGVPVALVSGDVATLAEARRILPWARTVETKRSLGYFAAECRSPAVVCEELRSVAEEAVRASAAFHPLLLETPIAMEIDTLSTAQSDAIELVPGFKRVAARTVGYRAPDPALMYRALMNAIYVGASVPA